jgi:hypothetical protein
VAGGSRTNHDTPQAFAIVQTLQIGDVKLLTPEKVLPLDLRDRRRVKKTAGKHQLLRPKLNGAAVSDD